MKKKQKKVVKLGAGGPEWGYSKSKVEESKKPKAKFHVGQPIEYDSSDARCWLPGKIKEVSVCDENDENVYLVGPDDLWCLESEIRELK